MSGGSEVAHFEFFSFLDVCSKSSRSGEPRTSEVICATFYPMLLKPDDMWLR